MRTSGAAFALNANRLILRNVNRQWSAPSSGPLKRPVRNLATMQLGQVTVDKLISVAVNRGVERSTAERVVSGARRALRDWTGTVSEFLTPPESAAMTATLSTLADIQVACWGGYEDAERTALLCAHEEIADSDGAMIDLLRDQFVLFKVAGNFEFDKASHRDFMGAILNAGVSRSKIGDILVLDTRGAEVIVSADIADFIQGAISSVRNVSVRLERCPCEEIEIPPKRVKELQSVESSMRLDAVVSAGFKVSRSKLADMARSGLVFVNYKEVKAPAKNVKTGDIVSVRGIGKLEIGECSLTSKGRYRIEMKRYI